MDEITNIMLQQIREIDERDESQVLAELAGETVADFIYETTDKRTQKRVVKLSWIGTREAGRARGNIHLSDPIIQDADGYVRLVVKATDLSRNFSVFGGCHQPKKQKVKVYDDNHEYLGDQEQDDPHYFAKALSKAQRNAIQSIIPANFIATVIDKFLKESGRPPLKQLPKPKEDKPRVAKELPAINPEDIPDLHSLELVCYNRYHIQPTQVYKELGYSNKSEVTEKPWDCFLKIKDIFEVGNGEK